MSTLPPDALPAPTPSPEGADAARALRVLEGLAQPFWERDLHTNQAWLSPRFLELLCLKPGAQRADLDARLHPDDRPAFEAAYAAAQERVGRLTHELRALDDNDRWRWLRLQLRFWPGADGRAAKVVGMLQDIDDERRARDDISALTERMSRAMEALSEAVVDGSAEPGDFFLSPNLPRILGYPAGTPAPDVHTYLSWVHPDDRETLRQQVKRSLQEAGRWDSTYRLRHADGQYRWMRGRGESRRGRDGQLRSVGMIGDIHEFTLAQQELAAHRGRLEQLVAERTARLDAALTAAEQARERAEAADRAKSVFLAHMSHEIRTPLNGLLGLTELALGGAESPAQRRYLEVALQSGHALLNVINDVLEISRLEAGTPQLASEPFDIAELLAEALRATVPVLGRREVTVRYDIDGGPTRLLGDAARLRQVAVNLLGNAAKFTERGAISLVARLRPGSEGRVAMEVEVQDTGPGIAPEVAAHVFEAFYQGDNSLSRRHGGTGLGLAIARGLARAMGGDLSLQSRVGAGSLFTLSLQLPAAPALAEAAPPLPPGLAWLLFGKQQDGDWLQRRIERLGWRAETVLGLDALEARAARGERPALVLVNPHQVLFEVADFGRLRRALPGVPVTLMIRADWADAAREREAMAQAMSTVVAPLPPAALAELLRDALARAQTPSSAPAHGGGNDVLLVEDNPVNQVIGQRLLEHLGLHVRSAQDGAQSVAACLEHAPDLVIMDVRMPVMDGLEATRRLRTLQREGRLPPFPVVGLSAHALETDRRAALEAGMDDYLTKPIDTERLRQAVRRWMGTPGPMA
jgi:PAS domain S-box-containing protein